MPISLDTILLFIPFMVLAAAAPGPDIIYIASRSLGPNRWAGVVAAAGIATGLCILSVAVALGLGQLFMFVPVAYDVMKYIGAAYLLYLAFKIIRASDSGIEIDAVSPPSMKEIYVQGIFTNLLNPKAIIFFMAVLPQFTDPSQGNIAAQLAAIAALATFLAFLTHSAVALTVHKIAGHFRNPSPLRARIQRYVLASMFGAVAVRLAISQKP